MEVGLCRELQSIPCSQSDKLGIETTRHLLPLALALGVAIDYRITLRLQCCDYGVITMTLHECVVGLMVRCGMMG
jgi:hypothetical protein